MKTTADSIVGADAVAAVRGFNRYYTGVIGVLREGLLDTPYSLTEARVIFELAQRECTEVPALRRALDLDAGYLSRLLTRFETARLVTRERSTADARRQVVRLTPHGWVIHRNGLLYAEEYGWDHSYEALVARIVADYIDKRQPGREDAWIAEVDGEPVGCVFCVKKTDEVAQLRLLLVDPCVRGMGIGGRLVEECLRFAKAAGYAEVMLWTNDVLAGARRIYERAGFELEREETHHSFGRDLVGQFWRRVL